MTAIGASVTVVAEASYYRAAAIVEFNAAFKIANSVNAILWVPALIWFTVTYSGSLRTRLWIPLTLSLIFVAAGIANLLLPFGWLYSEFTAKAVRGWLQRVGVQTLYIEPGSPWENGYVESFNSKLRDELLNREIFYNLWEAKALVERWRREYNHIRPHSSLGYRPPAPEVVEGPPVAMAV